MGLVHGSCLLQLCLRVNEDVECSATIRIHPLFGQLLLERPGNVGVLLVWDFAVQIIEHVLDLLSGVAFDLIWQVVGALGGAFSVFVLLEQGRLLFQSFAFLVLNLREAHDIFILDSIIRVP